MSTEVPPPATAASKEDTNKISMTLPPAVIAALKAEGEQLDMSAGEWVKHQVIAAYTQPGGVQINLHPVSRAPDPRQAELPLTMNEGGK